MRSARLLIALLAFAPLYGVRAIASDAPAQIDLRALDRDDTDAEAALAAGDLVAALRYFDYFGHEQEHFCRATLEYRIARQKFGVAVRESFGRREWGRAARALGVPRRRRGGRDDRSVRRDEAVVYLKNPGAGNEVPYVYVDGIWKVSARDVLVIALRARFGPGVAFEEADLHVLAGKMARVLRDRAARLSALTAEVGAKRVTSPEQLHVAIEAIRRGAPAQ